MPRSSLSATKKVGTGAKIPGVKQRVERGVELVVPLEDMVKGKKDEKCVFTSSVVAAIYISEMLLTATVRPERIASVRRHPATMHGTLILRGCRKTETSQIWLLVSHPPGRNYVLNDPWKSGNILTTSYHLSMGERGYQILYWVN